MCPSGTPIAKAKLLTIDGIIRYSDPIPNDVWRTPWFRLYAKFEKNCDPIPNIVINESTKSSNNLLFSLLNYACYTPLLLWSLKFQHKYCTLILLKVNNNKIKAKNTK